jgi:hypothetical protein
LKETPKPMSYHLPVKFILITLSFCTSIVFSTTAQVEKDAVQKKQRPRSYKSGTLWFSMNTAGKLYLDYNFIHDIRIFNLVKIKGIKPDNHTISLKTASDSITRRITIEKNRVYTCREACDSVIIKGRKATDWLFGRSEKIIFYEYAPRQRGIYNITQLGLICYSLLVSGKPKEFAGMTFPLNSISTILEYRFSPKISSGIGVAYFSMRNQKIISNLLMSPVIITLAKLILFQFFLISDLI